MASNAKFEIEIYGNTAKFENSLKGINTAMSGLKGEANALKKALALDPTNTDKMAQLQKNLQQQLTVSKNKATQLKQEIADVDKSTPQGQAKWTKLQRDLANTTIQADQLESDIKDVDNAIKNGKWETKAKIDMDTSSVDSKIGGFKQKFNGLKEIAVGAFRQIGASITNALGNGLGGWVSDAMSTQKAMISLKNTMEFKGIGSDVEYVKKSMSTLATATNANTEDTLKLATTFIGLGDNAKTAVSKTDALVKANQAFGGTGEQLKGVVQAYGQMSAAGKVSAENINQLTDNNTALGSALKSTVMEMNPTLKQYGSFAAASEKGAISVDMLDKAMQKLGGAGGGAVTTIGDAWDSFNETLSLALLPTLDALTPVISGLIDNMAGWGESAGKALTNVVNYVQKLFKTMQENGTTLAFLEAWDSIKSIFSSVISIIGNVIKSLLGINTETAKNATSFESVSKTISVFAGKLSEVASNIADFMKKLSENETAMNILKGTLVVLASAFAAFKVATGILKTVQAFKTMATAVKLVSVGVKGLFALIAGNPFVAIAVAIAAVVAGLVYFFTQTETGKKMWQSFVDFLASSIESIKQFFAGLGTWFSDLWNSIVEAIQTIWGGVVAVFQFYVDSYKAIFSALIEFFTGLWSGIVSTVQTVWNGVTSFFGTVVQGIMNFFQPLINFYQSLWNLIVSIINLAVQLILAGVRGAVQLIQKAWQVAGDFINSVWQNILNFFNPIINIIQSTVQTVTSAIGSFFSQAWSVVSGVWGVVAGWFSDQFNSVKNAVSNVFNAFGQFASNAWNSVTGVFSSVGSWFSNTFNSAKNAVSNVFAALGGIAQNAWNSITSVFSGVYDFFADAFGGVKDLIDSILGGISGTLDKISGAINGVSKTVSGMFKGSLVEALPNVNLSGVGNGGITQNSASADNRIYNTFTLGADNGNIVALAREVTKLQKLGRA